MDATSVAIEDRSPINNIQIRKLKDDARVIAAKDKTQRDESGGCTAKPSLTVSSLGTETWNQGPLQPLAIRAAKPGLS